jgi:hypothetical protein
MTIGFGPPSQVERRRRMRSRPRELHCKLRRERAGERDCDCGHGTMYFCRWTPILPRPRRLTAETAVPMRTCPECTGRRGRRGQDQAQPRQVNARRQGSRTTLRYEDLRRLARSARASSVSALRTSSAAAVRTGAWQPASLATHAGASNAAGRPAGITPGSSIFSALRADARRDGDDAAATTSRARAVGFSLADTDGIANGLKTESRRARAVASRLPPR